MVATLWRDNRVVTILSTNAQPHLQDVVQRRQRNSSRVDVPCPVSVAMYQKYMGGVDRNDQLRQYYTVRKKCRKFYKYILWFLFEASLTNSYVLYSNFSSLSRRQPLKQFRLQLAKSLIGDYHSKKRHNRHLAPPTSLSFLHFPLRRQNNDSNATLRGRCWFCWNRRQHQRRDTSWYCHECQIHLCHTGDPQTDCFMEHHK